MIPPNLKNLSSLSQSELLQILGQNSVVVLVGAGISCWEPTKLPTGQDFTSVVNNSIFRDPIHPFINQNDWNKLEELLRDVPFELLMERCPSHDKIRSILANLFFSRKPNPIHDTLSQLVKSGLIHSIITTNYDLSLDEALTGSLLKKVVQESDLPVSRARLYFKIHGCAGTPNSMVFSLKHESAMPEWKQGLLEELIENKVLLIIGYSGFDFEVCPEIARISVKSIVWNFFSQNDYERSPGFNHLKNTNINKTVLLGDMLTIFSLLGHPIRPQRYLNSQSNISSLLQNSFLKDELLLWRSRILNTMGNSRLALLSIDGLQPDLSTNNKVVLEYAQALFHNGKYLSAFNEFIRAVKLSSCPYEKLHLELDACDSLRCFGSYRRAHSMLNKIKKEIDLLPTSDIDLKSRVLLKELLMFYEIYKIFRKTRLFFLARILRDKSAWLIEQGAPLSLESGKWLDFQQYRFWCERFNLDASILANHNGYPPLPTKKGYKHLGYQVALLMEICDRAKQGHSTSNEIDEGLELAKYLGSHPSCWKIAQISRKSFPAQRRRWKQIYDNYLRKCEYSFPARVQFSLLGT